MNNLKPFNLEACIAGEPVVTRGGESFKFGGFNPDAEHGWCLIGWINNQSHHFRSNGGYMEDEEVTSVNDLFMAPKVGVMVVWKSLEEDYHTSRGIAKLTSHLFESKEAMIRDGVNLDAPHTIIEIEY